TTLSNGQFSDVVTIASGSGETWQVQANTGFFQTGGAPPPAAPVLIPLGTVIVESATDPGIYQLEGIHVDGNGFFLTVTNGTDVLNISNTCYYPNISITGFPD